MIEHFKDGSYGIGRVEYFGHEYTVTTPEGVHVAAYTAGPEYGVPILVIGGQPSSMQEIFVSQYDLEELSVRTYSFNRRGYAGTDYVPDSYLEDEVGDALAVMGDVPRFGIVARSAGVRTALVLAAALQDRISGLVLKGGTAPPSPKLDQLHNVTDQNKRDLQNAANNPQQAAQDITERARIMRERPDYLYEEVLSPSFQPADKLTRIICGLRQQIIRGHATAIGDGTGWLNGLLTSQKPWTRHGPLDLSRITAPTVVVHGEQDPFVSADNARLLAESIPNASLELLPNSSHMDLPLYTYTALETVRNYHLGSAADEAVRIAETRWAEELRAFEQLAMAEESWPGQDKEAILASVRRMMHIILTPEMFFNGVIRNMLQAQYESR